MHSLRLGAAALLVSGSVLSAGGAQAVGLDVLVAGGILTDGDLTFDGFTYGNAGAGFGGLAIGAGDIDVTLSTTATTATLLFDFVPDVALGTDAFYEIAGSFSGTVTTGPRTFVETTLTLIGASIAGTDFSFVEVAQTVPAPFDLLNVVSLDPFGSTPTDSEPLAGLTSFTHGWDSQGETEGDASAAIGGFEITYRLDGTRPPDPDPIPLPAGLPLLVGALGAIALLRRRAVAGS
ncbi:MAG: hypothetical protein V2I65_08110 [Paracoccaceae bacterium]|nr:hypothetical protein [Paracoccaceae bacterium]